MFKITVATFFLMLYIMSILRIIITTIVPKVDEADGEKEFIDKCSKINYADYCKKIGHCEEGTHLFCMYYKPGNFNTVMGPQCRHARMIKLDQADKDYVLLALNLARSNVAKGKARGTQGVTLPRGYGMMRLKWDPELYILAQLWANQCRFESGNHCLATKRFPRVADFQLMVRFTHPDWQSIGQERPRTKPCLTLQKIKQSLEESLNQAIDDDQYTSVEHIQNPSEQVLLNRKFLTLVHSNSSRIGCAMSSYQYFFMSRHRHGVHTVCYLSSTPEANKPVYNLEPGLNVTKKCGCPLPDYEEDEDCLCVLSSEVEREKTTTTKVPITTTMPTSSASSTIPTNTTVPITTTMPASSTIPTTTRENNEKDNCQKNPHKKQPVVVMPFITYENAPPEIILQLERSNVTSKASLNENVKLTLPKIKLLPGVGNLNLKSQNLGKSTHLRRNNILQNSVLANEDLKNILYNVPKEYRLGLEKLFLQTISELNIPNQLPVPIEKPLLRLVENYNDFNQADALPTNNDRNIQIDNNWVESRRTGNFVDNTNIVANRNKDNYQLVAPIIREQKPLVDFKANNKYTRNDNSENKYKKVDEPQKNDNYNIARNGIISINKDITLIKPAKTTGAHKKSKYIEESFISNNAGGVEEKLKRRVYLGNEISRLKNKLKHLRHLRRKNLNKNGRTRGLRKLAKLEGVNNFYMPDRAHPLHEF